MKKNLILALFIILAGLFISSPGSAQFSNYAAPQLEWISNAIPGLWDRPREDVLRMMAMFPDFKCGDYGDRISCQSNFNTKHNDNIYIAYFTDDYEGHRDNLWKVSVTADIQAADEAQSLFDILWLEGMKPSHLESDDFSFKGAQALYFRNKTTVMIAYFQPSRVDSNPFFLVEYEKAVKP